MNELKAAIKYDGLTVVGHLGQRHKDISPKGGGERGFVAPTGEFLSRSEAAEWLRNNWPDKYMTLSEGGKKFLHTEDLF